MLVFLLDEYADDAVRPCEYKKRFRKRKQKHISQSVPRDYKRYSFNENGSLHFVIEAGEAFYRSESFLLLKKRFKGAVLSSQALIDKNILTKDDLFDAGRYYSFCTVRSLIMLLVSGKYTDSRICVFDKDGIFIDRYLKVMCFVKAFYIFTENTDGFQKLSENCFSDFGFRPVLLKNSKKPECDLFADIDNSDCGVLTLQVNNGEIMLPPYRCIIKTDENLTALIRKGVSRDYVTAAFLQYDSFI